MARLLGGRLELIDRLGAGSTGVVWRASLHGDGVRDDVAVKLLYPTLAGDPAVIDRLEDARPAFEALAGVRHPAVVGPRDLFVEVGQVGVVTDLVEGADLGTRLARSGPLAPATAAGLAAGIADGLAEAHAVGVTHGDLKPRNVLVPSVGRWIHLVDFGAAQLVDGSDQRTVYAAAPEYTAPELILGDRPTSATDVYALGMMLFELLTGVPPYRGGSPSEVFARHLEAEPVWPPGLHSGLRYVLDRCLQNDPGCRPPCDAVAADLLALWPRLAGMAAFGPAVTRQPLFRRPLPLRHQAPFTRGQAVVPYPGADDSTGPDPDPPVPATEQSVDRPHRRRWPPWLPSSS